MTKENKKLLAAAAEKIKSTEKEIGRIGIEETEWGAKTEPGSMDHMEMCFVMAVAADKLSSAKDLIDKALNIADDLEGTI